MFRVVLSLCLFGVSGCGLILDFDPRPPTDTPDGSLDSGRLDLDASFSDADARDGSFRDANVDRDSGRAELDSGPDPVDAGPPRRCEDTTEDICIRVVGIPLVDDWAAQFNWTRPGGILHTINWERGRIDCIGGVRVIDAESTECEMIIPDPGTPVIDTGLVYIYPEHADGTSSCDFVGCPAYHAGWRLWVRGIEYPTDPAAPSGRCSLERRPALDSEHMVMRMNLP